MKSKILEKSIELFKSKGFDKVSIDEISSECRVTKGSFYHYYDSKYSVVSEYFESLIKNDQEVIKELILKDSVLEQLWGLIEHLIDCTLTIGPDLLGESLIASIKHKELLVPVSKDCNSIKLNNLLQIMVKLIEKGQRNGEIKNLLPAEEIFMSYMLGFLGTTLYWSTNTVKTIDLKEMLKKSFDLNFHR